MIPAGFVTSTPYSYLGWPSLRSGTVPFDSSHTAVTVYRTLELCSTPHTDPSNESLSFATFALASILDSLVEHFMLFRVYAWYTSNPPAPIYLDHSFRYVSPRRERGRYCNTQRVQG